MKMRKHNILTATIKYVNKKVKNTKYRDLQNILSKVLHLYKKFVEHYISTE